MPEVNVRIGRWTVDFLWPDAPPRRRDRQLSLPPREGRLRGRPRARPRPARAAATTSAASPNATLAGDRERRCRQLSAPRGGRRATDAPPGAVEWRRWPTDSARALPDRRQLARLPGLLRAARVDRDRRRAADQRDLRARLDAGQNHRRAPSRAASSSPGTRGCRGARSPTTSTRPSAPRGPTCCASSGRT